MGMRRQMLPSDIQPFLMLGKLSITKKKKKNELKKNTEPRGGEIPPLGANEHISQFLLKQESKRQRVQPSPSRCS